MPRTAAIALALTSSLAAQSLVGEPAPPWNVEEWFQLPEGKTSLTPADFAGKVVYLFCFQSFSKGSHTHGFQRLQKLVGMYEGRTDVAFVAVQTVYENFRHNTRARAELEMRRYRFEIPFGHDARDGSRIKKAYRTQGTPWVIVIDKRGIVRFSDFHTPPEQARKLIDRLLEEPINPLVGEEFGSIDTLEWVRPDRAPELGKLTLFRWWTDGCPHCRASLPDLDRLRREYGERGLRVVGVYHQKTPEAPTDDSLSEYLDSLEFGGDFAIDPEWAKLRELRKRGELDGPTSSSFLVDARGVVRWVNEGPRLHRTEDPEFKDAASAMTELERLLTNELGTASKQR